MSGFCVNSTSITALSHFCGACQCSAGRTLVSVMSKASRLPLASPPDESTTVTLVCATSPRTKMRPLSSTVPKRPPSSPSVPCPFCASRFLFFRLPGGAGRMSSADADGGFGGGSGAVKSGGTPADGRAASDAASVDAVAPPSATGCPAAADGAGIAGAAGRSPQATIAARSSASGPITGSAPGRDAPASPPTSASPPANPRRRT